MKKLLLVAALGFGVFGVQAQDSTQIKKKKMRTQQMAKRMHPAHQMDSVLQLTEAQKLQLKSLHEEYQKKRLAVYTPEQKARLEQFQKERSSKMKERGKTMAHRSKKGPMVSNLTEQQKATMKNLRAKNQQEAAVIKANTALSDADKKTKLKALHTAQREEMRKILTPEQLQELNQRAKRTKDGPAR